MEGMINLTKEEQKLNDIIIKLIGKEINIKQACRLTGLSERQVYRKQKALQAHLQNFIVQLFYLLNKSL